MLYTLIIVLCLSNSFSGCPADQKPPANTIRYEHLTKDVCEARRQELLAKHNYVLCVPEKN